MYAIDDLVTYIITQDTYASMVRTLGKLKEKHRTIVGLALRSESVIVKEVRKHFWFNLDHFTYSFFAFGEV